MVLWEALAPETPPRRRWVVATALASVVFAICATFSVGGLARTRWPGDVAHYQDFAVKMHDQGLVPYRDFYVEYPPGALPAFAAPEWISPPHYRRVFKALMGVCGLVTLALVTYLLVRLRASRPRLVAAAALVALTPALLGHVYINRYDPWAAVISTAALVLLVADRARSAGAALALAVAAKVFAVAAIPLVAIRFWRRGGRPALVGAAIAFAVVLAAIFLPFVAIAFGGVGFSFYTQVTRLLQAESIAASALFVADQLGLYHVTIVGGLSIDIGGTFPKVLGVLSSLASVAAVLFVTWRYWREEEDDERFVVAFAACVTAFTVFAKVISPQYLTWVVPLVALVGGRYWRICIPLTVMILGATQAELYGFDKLMLAPWAVWVLALRNVLLIVLFVVLVRALSAPSTARVDARARPPVTA